MKPETARLPNLQKKLAITSSDEGLLYHPQNSIQELWISGYSQYLWKTAGMVSFEQA